MTRVVRRRVALGVILVILLAAMGATILVFVGVLGEELQEAVWRTWSDANAVADRLHKWLEKSGKLLGVLIALGQNWLLWFWSEIRPHLQWLGPLFGIAMAAWRWWDKRESVVWRRAMRLLADQGRYVQDCCEHSLAAVLYPSPATPPQQPLFAVRSLRRVFARGWRHPLDKARPIIWGKNLLQRAHEQLDEKDGVISLHRSFAVAQRYSAFVLQGAIAAAIAIKSSDAQSRNRSNQTALDRFENALALEGKASDAVVLELKCLQLRKLGRVPEAIGELIRLQTLLEGRLQAVAPLAEAERQALSVQLSVVRYQSEIDHKLNANGNANLRILTLLQNPIANKVLQGHLEFQARLERARLHVRRS
jgi:hypothetical protein